MLAMPGFESDRLLGCQPEGFRIEKDDFPSFHRNHMAEDQVPHGSRHSLPAGTDHLTE